jgi:GT2 family glycosyltransferase
VLSESLPEPRFFRAAQLESAATLAVENTALDRQTSIVICSRDRPALLVDTVYSILDADTCPAEIVVIDQSDEVHPGLPAKDGVGCAVRYFHSPGRGLSRARNEALRYVQHPVVVFTDDDVLVDRTWLSRLLASVLAERPYDVITGRVLPAASNDRNVFMAPNSEISHRRVFDGRTGVDPLITFNMAIRRDLLAAVGGFDERLGPGTSFPAGEDNDLAFRLLESGIRIVVEPDAVVYHRAWRPVRQYVPLQWHYGRGHGAFLAKHISAGDGFMLRRLVGTLVRVTARSPVYLFARRDGHIPRIHLMMGDLAFAAGTLTGAIQWVRRYERGSRSTAAQDSIEVAS